MDFFINDFRLVSFLLGIFPVLIILGFLTAIYAMIILAKDQKESLGVKIIVFISFFVIPVFSSIFYLLHHNFRKKS